MLVRMYIVIVIHFLLTCWWEMWIFTGSRIESLLTWGTIKSVTFAVIAGFWYILFTGFSDKKSHWRRIMLYSLPYALLLLIWFSFKVYGNYTVSSDEERILNAVKNYNIFPEHFLYPTGLFTAISMQLIPSIYGPIIGHILFQSFVCGYCIEKLKSKWIYGVFLLYPVIINGWMFHRMQTYGLFYLILFVKCYADYQTGKYVGKYNFIVITLLCSILSFWRREGLYLFLTGIIILVTTYRIKKEYWARSFLVYAIIAFWVFIPEISHDIGKNSSRGESGLAYVVAFTQMERMGLDVDKYPEQKEILEETFDLSMVNKINRILGTKANDDAYLAWDVKGVTESFKEIEFPKEIFDGRKYITLRKHSSEVSEDFCNAVKCLIIHEPIIFLQSRLSMFHSASMNGNHSKGWYSWVKAIFWNLYLPLLCIICSLWRNLRTNGILTPLVWLDMGLILHTVITMLVSPCGYFKYYYHVYLIGWTIFFIWLSDFIKKWRGVHNA